jgi:hypothetical protein
VPVEYILDSTRLGSSTPKQRVEDTGNSRPRRFPHCTCPQMTQGLLQRSGRRRCGASRDTRTSCEDLSATPASYRSTPLPYCCRVYIPISRTSRHDTSGLQSRPWAVRAYCIGQEYAALLYSNGACARASRCGMSGYRGIEPSWEDSVHWDFDLGSPSFSDGSDVRGPSADERHDLVIHLEQAINMG